jgi:thiamine-phosphate pyrophosphorylase
MRGQRSKLRGLYAVTPDSADTASLVERASQALTGGARMLQYRNKTADAMLRRAQATALLARCRAAGVPLIINDDLALALELGADGVHLGREDRGVALARRTLGPGAIVGASCYDDLDRGRAAVADGADYVAFGSAYPSPTKPGAVRAPLALYGQAARKFAVPVAAIGGITVGNALPLIVAGVDLLAVITDLFDTPDVAARAAAYAALFANIEDLP